MFELNGKYTDAKVMIDSVDAETQKQIIQFINDPNFTNPISIMPDCHAGKGAVVGFTMELGSTVIPNVIGVDIGCGMLSVNVGERLPCENVEKLDEHIRSWIPFGTDVHTDKYEIPSYWFNEVNQQLVKMCQVFRCEYKPFNQWSFVEMCERAEMNTVRALSSIGTLGGGNHFIEVGISTKDDYWLTFHSGSRQLGQKIAVYHQRLAGKGDLAWLYGQKMYDYLQDMVVAQMYAKLNREWMFRLVASDYDVREKIESVHNFIDFDDFVIRKGAIRSYKGEKMIIPFNPADGILICEGKSNPKWNFSAPHGAGRTMSRKQANSIITRDDADAAMAGVYASRKPLDESPLAYKNPLLIENAIKDTAIIIDRLKPILNCKE